MGLLFDGFWLSSRYYLPLPFFQSVNFSFLWSRSSSSAGHRTKNLLRSPLNEWMKLFSSLLQQRQKSRKGEWNRETERGPLNLSACLGQLIGIALGSEHWYTAPCPGPWVRNLVTTNSLLDPSTTSKHFSWFYLVYLILTIIVCQICHVKCEIETWKYKKFILKNPLRYFLNNWPPHLLKFAQVSPYKN